MFSLRSKIRWLAIYSRGFVLLLQILADQALPDHSPPDSYRWWGLESRDGEDEHEEEGGDTLADQLLSSSLDGLVRWDAHQHLQIADVGYAYEHHLAFFPLYPLAVKSVAGAAHWALGDSGVVSRPSLLKLSAAYVNLVAFVAAADILYSLSRRVLKDEALAYRACLLFCLNPASVFFSAPYPEALFSCAAFAAMLAVEARGPGGLAASLLLAAASGVRADGIANALFVVHHSMKTVATKTILFVRAKKKNSAGNKGAKGQTSTTAPKRPASDTVSDIATSAILPGAVSLVSAAAPLLAFQWFAYRTFCEAEEGDLQQFPHEVEERAREAGFVMPGAAAEGSNSSRSSWCFSDPPVSFHYVHTHYWGAGFLKYWETKYFLQFFSAVPATGLVFWQLYLFCRTYPRYSSRLGLVDNARLGLARPRDPDPPTKTLSLPRPAFVYVAHASASALALLLLFPVHQATRVLCSSSPVLYWFAALLTLQEESDLVPVKSPAQGASKEDSDNYRRDVCLKVERARNLENRHATVLLQEKAGSDASHWVKLYFLGYMLVGTVIFANNFPWT